MPYTKIIAYENALFYYITPHHSSKGKAVYGIAQAREGTSNPTVIRQPKIR
jgi:hypothetical protein